MKNLSTLRRTLLLSLSVFCGFPSFSQTGFFDILAHEKSRSEYPVKASILKYSLLRIDEAGLRQYLLAAPLEFQQQGAGIPLEVPLPDGQTEIFSIEESPILAPAVAAEHPDIKTYTGKGTKHPERIIRFSLTAAGFGGIILNVNRDAVYFESYKRDSGLYLCYAAGDVRSGNRTPAYRCGLDSDAHKPPGEQPAEYRNNTGGTLRTYELAFAATGEFTQHPDYGNGSISTAYGVLVNYANNMAAVFRVEMCVSFILVNGTETVYDDPMNDPYTNNDQSAMLTENQDNLDMVIGSGNYDIGHVLGYLGFSGGGIASLEALCDGSIKGKGVSGVCDLNFYPQVYNDQLVYHEIGHQFGMTHSYNSVIPVCTTRSAPTSVEPGAGATIMSYGFTCDGDDYETPAYGPIIQFHTASYAQAYAYITNTNPGYGGSCPTNTSTGNTLPAVTVPTAKTIPVSTPFMLTGSATDANGDALTYCWEGTNIGTMTPTAATLDDPTQPPFFRSYAPVSSGTRIYPRLEAILDGSYQGKGDKLPSVGVVTTHRLTVRDNRSTGGATVYSGVNVTVSASSGPFFVFNLGGPYPPGSSQTVTWSVAGTTAAPVSCANVDILLSTDGGQTFPITLTANTPNDGTQSVTLPNVNTTSARVMVQCSNNIFFDISNNFQIQGALPVELLHFEAQLKNRRDAWLTWQTTSETNHAGFDVEMAAGNGNEFKKMGFVRADAQHHYEFTVPELADDTYYFRLKQLDMDGAFEYGPIRMLKIGSDAPSISVFPNPSESTLNVVFSRFDDKEVVLHFVNQIGQTVRTVRIPAGTELFPVDIRDLPAGVYVVSTQSNTNVENIRFVKE